MPVSRCSRIRVHASGRIPSSHAITTMARNSSPLASPQGTVVILSVLANSAIAARARLTSRCVRTNKPISWGAIQSLSQFSTVLTECLRFLGDGREVFDFGRQTVEDRLK